MLIHDPRLNFSPPGGPCLSRAWPAALLLLGMTFALPAIAARPAPPALPRCATPTAEKAPAKAATIDSDAASPREPTEAWSDGSVTVGGTAIEYCAVAGILVVHPKDWDDTAKKDKAAGKDDQEDSEKRKQ